MNVITPNATSRIPIDLNRCATPEGQLADSAATKALRGQLEEALKSGLEYAQECCGHHDEKLFAAALGVVKDVAHKNDVLVSPATCHESFLALAAALSATPELRAAHLRITYFNLRSAHSNPNGTVGHFSILAEAHA